MDVSRAPAGAPTSTWSKPVVPRRFTDRLPGYHAGLVPTRLDVMTRFSLSTKLLEYIHLGIPAIIPAIPTYLDYFPATSAWYFTPNSAPEAARVIAQFASADPAERVRRAREAQQHAARRLDPVRDAEVLRQVYRKLLNPP